MKKILTSISLVVLALVVNPSSVAAEEMRAVRLNPTRGDQGIVKSRLATRSGMRNFEVHCQGIEEKIATSINRYNTNGQQHRTQYTHMRTKLQKVITTLESKDVDVTKLKADLQMLDTKIKTFNEDLDAVITQLQTAQQFPCGESEGRFLSEMAKARELMKEVKQDVDDIRTFYTKNIKTDVKNLRATIAKDPVVKPTP